MAYKMKPKGMGNNSYGMMPSNNKPKGKMAKIKGAGERRVVGGSGFIGYLGGGAAKLGMKIAAKLTGHTAVKTGSKVYGYEKGGKMTNTFKGLFNKSVKDKPAYGIDQYSYAKTKGRASVEAIKKGYPSVDPNLLKKYPTGPKLHKFHKDEAKKFMNKK